MRAQGLQVVTRAVPPRAAAARVVRAAVRRAAGGSRLAGAGAGTVVVDAGQVSGGRISGFEQLRLTGWCFQAEAG